VAYSSTILAEGFSTYPTPLDSSDVQKYYAVVRGRRPGIYYNWLDCKSQVDRFRGARYKSFATKWEADEFLRSSGM
jgi:viroplasmin and RNaseH domain-containing protein